MSARRFRSIKPEIRIVGVDDGVFTPHTIGKCDVIGVVFRGGYWLDGVMHTQVEIDGMDATEKIGEMITNSPHHRQLRIIMLDGVTFAGFNVVDIKKLNMKTKLPVIAVTREKPNFTEIREALKNLPKSEERWKAMLNTEEIFGVSTRSESEKIYMQIYGILEENARKILQLTSTRSNIPEALRVAHIIASGLTRSEEKI